MISEHNGLPANIARENLQERIFLKQLRKYRTQHRDCIGLFIDFRLPDGLLQISNKYIKNMLAGCARGFAVHGGDGHAGLDKDFSKPLGNRYLQIAHM
jgi:hypothetical protein